MSDQKTFSGSILRIFEARAKPGCADALAKKFATTSVDVVKDQSGNQRYFFGKSISGEDDVLVPVAVEDHQRLQLMVITDHTELHVARVPADQDRAESIGGQRECAGSRNESRSDETCLRHRNPL